MLALANARVVDVPELGPLRTRVPLPEVVAEREDALLRAGTLLVATRTADRGVEPVLFDGVEQRRCLEAVARRAWTGLLDHAAPVDRLLDRCDDQALVELGDAAVAELDHLGEVVAGVDVHDRERELARAERLLGEAEQHDRVLAAGEEEHRPLELRSELAEDVDRLGLELVEMRKSSSADAHRRAKPRHAATTFSSASRSRTAPADSAGLTPVVSSVTSGLLGAS